MYRLVSRLANLGDRLVSDTGVSSEFGVLATQLTLRPTVQVTVVCVYRPPGVVSQLFCQHLADVLDQLVTAKQRFVVCGDFNCPGAGDRHLDVNLEDFYSHRT